MPVHLCGICHKKCKRDTVYCAGCKNWVHVKCTDMAYKEAITKSCEGNLICSTCLQEENTPLMSMAMNKDQVSKMLVYL